jgi:hypothetical protein
MATRNLLADYLNSPAQAARHRDREEPLKAFALAASGTEAFTPDPVFSSWLEE